MAKQNKEKNELISIRMAEQQRQSLCPRLIDYLTIVGARSHTVGRTGVGPNPPIQPTSKRTTEKKKTSDSNRIDKLKPRSEKARTSKITRGRVSGPDVTVAKSSNDGKTKMPQASTSREPHSYASSVAKARKTSDAKYQYAIDCNKVADSIDVNDLKAFLEKNLKVNGEKNNLKSCVTIRCEGEKVVIDSKTFLPKKCLRFLSKKYLKRNWNIRVVSKNKFLSVKLSYELRLINFKN
ncbi:60S ribosomal protein L22 [Pseudolycoriella hygida]|uniref:Large ribosomal subunit protein eL22 n=1 Tax=Pseudolycoriella hygida TaxID=35572 RepID=A0A9Q0MYB8_9DIPT|nr:60S ribosomal protein L22 [Pseudolycoriella hygida]